MECLSDSLSRDVSFDADRNGNRRDTDLQDKNKDRKGDGEVGDNSHLIYRQPLSNPEQNEN